MTADPFRLPDTVVPTHYDLAIAPDLAASRFEGTAGITVTVREPVEEVVLNAAELEIHTALARDASGRELVGAVSLDGSHERLTVRFPSALAAGEAVLTLTYSGAINDQLHGFYRSTFVDADGHEQVIATTQFEPADARRAFPCWDEPAYKATFAISLLVPAGLCGLSNGAAVEERAVDGGRWVRFERTMKMSTYLVAFIVGPLVVTDPVDVDGVPLRVACVAGRERLSAFALEVGAHALRYLADYFDIPYPAGKLDLVALPDFAFGAMENLGCVTFRETALLVDRDHASRPELERVADVVSHEIAHMWFGDLVTMRWWNGIWLNEAFATFMEVGAVNDFRPEWDRWTSFSTERGVAMVTDALAATRPVEYEVVSPADADGMFDVLTYQKGGAVLRMLETYLGADRFRAGIRLYLDRHRYANTETTDLWDAIEEATGEPVRSIMDSWIFQGGYPMLSVEPVDGGVTVTQQRFRYQSHPTDVSARWQAPLLYRPLRAPDAPEAVAATRTLLSEAVTRLAWDDAPIVVNAGGWGFFRTRYAPDLLHRLLADLPALGPVERYNLVSDTWAMALAALTPLADFVDLVGLLGAERDPSVWDLALDAVGVLYRVVPDDSRPALSAWLRDLAGPVFAELGWQPRPGEDERTAQLRGSLLTTLGTLGDDRGIQKTARTLHDAALAGRSAPAPDLLASLVSIVAWTGTEADYELFWERIRAAATPQEEVRYLFRLAAFPDPALVLRTMDATNSDIRTQNGAFVIGAALANRVAGRQAWRWLVEHWDQTLARIPVNSHGRLLDGIVRLTDPDSVQEIPAFLAAHPIPSATKQVAQLLERQRINAAFAARERGPLAERFPAGPPES